MMRWRRFRQREQRDEDLAREIESYIAHEIDDNIARGMSEDEARQATRRRFGNQTSVREQVYEMRSLGLIESTWSDMAHGIRQLRRNPAFASWGILIMALGIASTTVIFSMTYGVLIRDLPYKEPDRLVTLGSSPRASGFQSAYAGAADYFDWRRQQQVFEDVGLTRPVANYNLTGAGEPERLQGARVTASLFSTLGAVPLIGRTFSEEERLDPGKASIVAVLSYGLWQRRFGGDPGIVGRKIVLDGTPHEVLGVMRPEFRYPAREFELWTPLYIPGVVLKLRGDNSYLCVARLKPGVAIEQARAHMNVVAGNLARDYPKTNKDVRVFVGPMLNDITGSVRRALWVLLGAAGVLFLAGCINLTNLLLARAANRNKEFALRASLGATRSRLARQFFAEAIPLAAAGAALGILGAYWLLRLLIPLLPPSMPRIDEIGLNGPVLLVSIALSAGVAFLVTLAPAAQIRASLERGPASRGRVRDVLIVTQIACTVLLLVTAGLLMRSFSQLRSTHPGFGTARVLSLHLAANRIKYGDDPGVARYLGRLIACVETVPGVEAVGLVDRLPLGGSNQNGPILFEGQDTPFHTEWRSASPDYFRALEVPLLAGRTFNESDSANRPAVGIIDDRLAREVFGGESPIGKRFRIDVPGRPWVEVVGVVGHLRHEGLDRDPLPLVYWSYQQRTYDRMAMVVKTTGDPSSLTAVVRAAIRSVDSDQPLYDVRPMTAVVERTLHGQWLNTVLVAAFAVMALMLASAGLYGVVSYLTAQRQREFGIRLAVGAKASDVLALVLKQGLGRAAVGLALGLVLSAALTRALAAVLHGVSAWDATTYVSVSGLLIFVVLAASFLPAWRASRLDPTAALRQE
jgi:putative ABC transport system permease protein